MDTKSVNLTERLHPSTMSTALGSWKHDAAAGGDRYRQSRFVGIERGGSMPVGEEPRVYEIRIHGCASTEVALALQGPIARVLCPDEEHDGPCDVPWGFTLGDDERCGDDETAVLVLGVYTTRRQAEEVADRVRVVAGEAGPAVVSEGDPEQFETLVEQYQTEYESRRP